jgi:hypothetical protein
MTCGWSFSMAAHRDGKFDRAASSVEEGFRRA